jgi:hypothetical protein
MTPQYEPRWKKRQSRESRNASEAVKELNFGKEGR